MLILPYSCFLYFYMMLSVVISISLVFNIFGHAYNPLALSRVTIFDALLRLFMRQLLVYLEFCNSLYSFRWVFL